MGCNRSRYRQVRKVLTMVTQPLQNRPVCFAYNVYLNLPRYSQELLRLFVEGDNVASDGDRSMNLAACVARARSACKLRYIVGGAPVIYGVPVCKL
jgi:hypothetical protein